VNLKVKPVEVIFLNSKFILSKNKKGWLPQYVINSSLSNVQLDFVEALRNYLSNEINTV